MLRLLILTSVKIVNYISRKLATAFGFHYQIIVPYATYAPWLLDKAFMDTLSATRKNRLVDIYQCWELWCLVEQTGKIDGDVLEVGVYRGGTTAIIAMKMKLLGQNSNLFCCDTFDGVVKASQQDNFYRGGEFRDTSADYVRNLLATLGIDNFTILQGVFPEDTAQLISNHSFRLCHIDVDTYKSAEDILTWVWPRLRVGGAVVFSDYGYPRIKGITKLVQERRMQRDSIFIHNLNGNGIMLKIEENSARLTPTHCI
jgi:O-methyltransferase